MSVARLSGISGSGDASRKGIGGGNAKGVPSLEEIDISPNINRTGVRGSTDSHPAPVERARGVFAAWG